MVLFHFYLFTNSDIAVNSYANRYFRDVLYSEENYEIIEYFEQLNINTDTLQKFNIGYSMPQWANLTNNILKEIFSDSGVQEAGLIIPKKKGGYYDRFRGRVIFPYADETMETIGFVGRVIDDSLPKYLSTPVNIVFNRGNNLFGISKNT